MYSLAIRKRYDDNDFFWNHDDYEFRKCDINCNKRYWLADPFLFEKDNIAYLFYEAYDLIERKGKIAYSIICNNGSYTAPKIVLDEAYHLSFPNVFKYDGEIYMMPESCGDYRVKLWKSVSFPDIWELADVILPDIYACDSIILENENVRYLLANEMYHNTPNGFYISCWVKSLLYKLDGFRTITDGVKVLEGEFGIRNAGRSFSIGEKLYRIGQDCRNNIYGKGLVLFEVETMVPYKEKLIWSKDNHEMAKHIVRSESNPIIGIHTYNFSRNYEIIDYSYMSSLKFSTTFRRGMRPISIRIKNLIK